MATKKKTTQTQRYETLQCRREHEIIKLATELAQLLGDRIQEHQPGTKVTQSGAVHTALTWAIEDVKNMGRSPIHK